MHHFVYIIYSHTIDKFYIGRSENVERRLLFHNNPIESRKFTAKGIPWVLKRSIHCDSIQIAINLEKFIKRMKSRKFIESLIADEGLVKRILERIENENRIAPDC